MKHARKPLSFLLALVMVVGLLAAAPVSAAATLAEPNVEIFLDTDYTTSIVSNTTVAFQTDTAGLYTVKVTTSSATPTLTLKQWVSESEQVDTAEANAVYVEGTNPKSVTYRLEANSKYIISASTATSHVLVSHANEVSGGSATLTSGNLTCFFTPTANGLYKITKSDGTNITSVKFSGSATELKSEGGQDGGVYKQSAEKHLVFRLTAWTPYAITADAACTVSVSTPASISLDTKYTGEAWRMFVPPADGMYTLTDDTSLENVVLIKPSDGSKISGSVFMKKDEPYAVFSAAAASFKITKDQKTLTVGTDSEKFTAATNFLFSVSSDGLYLVTSTATKKSGVTADGTGAAVTVAPSDHLSSGDLTAINTPPSVPAGSTINMYQLTSGTSYTVKAGTPSNTTNYEHTVKVERIPTVPASGGSADKSPVLKYASGSYNFCYVQFKPTTTGWYTITVPVKGAVTGWTYSSGASLTDAQLKPTGWATGNLTIAGACSTLGGVVKLTAGTNYIFKYQPTVDGSTSDVTASISINKEGGFVTMSGTTASLSSSNLKPGGTTWVKFTAPASAVTPITITPAEGQYIDSTGIVLYDSTGDGSSTVTLDSVTTEGNVVKVPPQSALTVNKVYYLVIKNDADPGYCATSAKVTIDLPAVTVQAKKINDSSVVSATVDGVDPEAGGGSTYVLTKDRSYTMRALADGFLPGVRTFTANGADQSMYLYPTPTEPKMLDGSNNPVASNYKVQATAPAAGSNVINVTVTAKNLKPWTVDGTEGYWVGIRIPVGNSYTCGTGTYSGGGATAKNIDPQNASDPMQYVYVNAAPTGTLVSSAWIEVTYAGGLALYKLDLSGVTLYKPESVTGLHSYGTTVKSQPVVSVAPTVPSGDKAQAATVAKSFQISGNTEINDDAASRLTGLDSILSSAKTQLGNYWYDATKDPLSLSGLQNTDFNIIGGGKNINATTLTAAEKQAILDALDTVLVVPVTTVKMTGFVKETTPSMTFEITAANRVLTTAASTASSFDPVSAPFVTDRTSGGTLKTRADLHIEGKSTAYATGNYETINAIQSGADHPVTVNGPVEISVKANKDDSNALFGSAATVYVYHTKSGSATPKCVYEATHDQSNTHVVKFVSAYGFSSFTIKGTNDDHTAAYIERQTPAGKSKMWFASIGAALAAAQSGETVHLIGEVENAEITAYNTGLTSVNIKCDSTTSDTTQVQLKAKSIRINGIDAVFFGTSTNKYAFWTSGTGSGSGSGSDPSDPGTSDPGTSDPGTITGNVVTPITSSGSGTVSLTSGNYNPVSGQTITWSAIASAGYKLSRVEVYDRETSTVLYTSYATTGSYTLTTNHKLYIRGYFTYTGNTVIIASTTHGTVTASSYSPAQGATVYLTVKPDSGYRLSDLTITSSYGQTITYSTYTGTAGYTHYFTMPYGNVTVTATFGSSTGVTVVTAVGGTVTYTPTSPSVGATVYVTCTPDSGYKLSSLTAKNTTTSAAVTLTAAASTATYHYTFTMPSGGVTLTPVWTAGVTIVPNTQGTVTASSLSPSAGATVYLTVTPNAGYQLSELQVRTTIGTTVVTQKLADNRFSFTMPSNTGVLVTAIYRYTSAVMPYTDSITPWASSYVQYCYSQNLMTGTTTTTFNGTAYVTRGSIWTILARIDGYYPSSTGNPWYVEARSWAMQKYTGGQYLSDGTNGGSNITREDFAVMLWRYKGAPASSQSLSKFSDAAKIDTWADTAMRWAVENNILQGSNGKINPRDPASRYEVAAMIARFDALA